jgi:hypothetical protein
MAEWQKIAAAPAPKDGRDLILGWRSKTGSWEWVKSYWDEDGWSHAYSVFDQKWPTHWMIPEPPHD